MNTSPVNTPRKDASDRELEQRARAIHERACASVDARAHARLAAARREALAAARRSPRLRVWLSATGAFAAAMLVVGVLWFKPGATPGTPPGPQQDAAADAELPPDADNRQLEMYQNLDFYQWLAQQPDARAPHTGGKP